MHCFDSSNKNILSHHIRPPCHPCQTTFIWEAMHMTLNLSVSFFPAGLGIVSSVFK